MCFLFGSYPTEILEEGAVADLASHLTLVLQLSFRKSSSKVSPFCSGSLLSDYKRLYNKGEIMQ